MAPYDRKALRRAIRQRNLVRLEQILGTVKDQGLAEHPQLVREVREARKLLNVLVRMNTINTSLQELNQQMLSELANEKFPNKITVAIMKGVMVILGVPEKKLETWTDVQKEMGTLPTQNYAFIRRLVKVKSMAIEVNMAREALKQMGRFSLDQERVKAISEPLALFYSWLTTIAQEVISVAETGPDDEFD